MSTAPGEGEANRRSRRFRTVATGPAVRVAVTIAVLLALLQGIDVESVGALFGQFRLSYFALAVGVAILANALGALAWNYVLEALGVVLPRREVARLYLVGLFFALFTPGGVAGDVVRTFELQRRGQGVEGFTSIVATRILSVGALAILGALSAVAILPGLVSSQITVAVLGLSGLALTALLMSGRLRPFAGRLPWRRLASVAERFLDSVEVLRTKPRALATASVLYGLHHLLIVIAIYLAALALDVDMSLGWALALIPIARVLVLLPLSISGLGVQELAFVVLFQQVGLDAAAAFSVSLLSHLVLIAVPLAGGAVFLASGRTSAFRGVTPQGTGKMPE